MVRRTAAWTQSGGRRNRVAVKQPPGATELDWCECSPREGMVRLKPDATNQATVSARPASASSPAIDENRAVGYKAGMQSVTRVHAAAAAALLVAGLTLSLRAQERPSPAPGEPIPLQPLAQQVRRLESALGFLGQPLPPADRLALNEAIAMSDEAAAV